MTKTKKKQFQHNLHIAIILAFAIKHNVATCNHIESISRSLIFVFLLSVLSEIFGRCLVVFCFYQSLNNIRYIKLCDGSCYNWKTNSFYKSWNNKLQNSIFSILILALFGPFHLSAFLSDMKASLPTGLWHRDKRFKYNIILSPSLSLYCSLSLQQILLFKFWINNSQWVSRFPFIPISCFYSCIFTQSFD